MACTIARVKTQRIALAATLALLVLLAAGCDGDEEAAPPPETTTPGETTPDPGSGETTFAVYLLRDGKITALRRSVASTPAVARASLEALLAGPNGDEKSDGLATAIPEGTMLRDLSVADGVATVDLSGEFDDGGGSASMLGRVAQVVATVTQFPTIKRVAFRLDGEPVQAIGGEGVVVDPPIGRKAIEQQSPQILIESPLPEDTVTSPIRLRGTANVFEATVSIEVRDDTGKVVYEGFTTATSGTGTRGTFDTTVQLPDLEGPIEIVAFEASAEDGRPLHVAKVPVVLSR
jgi:germination protein M